MHETRTMECPMNSERVAQYYPDYLGLKGLLELQKPLSLREGKLIAHDEMLFIIIHQAYELWFKQILHEVTACKEVMSKPEADDNGADMNLVVHRLDRVVEIWKLLNHQVDVLETMTPLDFLEFRELLHGASGFQSRQFRQIEASLGLKVESRFRPDYYKHTRFGGFNEADMAEITAFEEQETLLGLVEKWLERMPFFGAEFWRDWEEAPADASQSEYAPFWTRYRGLYERSLSERDEKAVLLDQFDDIFFRTGWGAFRPGALRAALFIMLYRDEPIFRLPFALLNSLIEIDEHLGNFRYRHLQMVRRMIGSRVGTGGSSGQEYLQGAVNKNYIFKELTGITTYLIERCHLPTLPPRLRHALRFSFSGR
ncbi:MAG: tryptophan 2,3-dioxygenase family protein [Chthoniobacterales bacterium]